MRGATLSATCIGVLIALLTRCSHDSPCAAGAPCNESQVGVACGGTSCTKFVCDGVEYGAQPKTVSDPCDQPGTFCPGSSCAGALVCESISADANVLFEGKSVIASGQQCFEEGTVCDGYCETCTCDGAVWSCTSASCNDVDAGDALAE